jgi:flagellar motor switch protein FliN/FliY
VNAEQAAVQEALARELAIVVGALSASDASVGEGRVQPGGHWTATLTVSGPLTGTCAIALDQEGVTAVTRALLGGEVDTPEETLAGTVGELLTQAAAAVSNAPDARGLRIDVSTATFVESAKFSPAAFARAVSTPLLTSPLVLVIDGTLNETTTVQQKSHAAAPVEAASVDSAAEGRIAVLLDIELPVVVRFGHTALPLRALTRLSPGSVIDLGRSPDDPVELLVSDRVIARGEVVIVGGNYGVRILDVVSQSERVRSMEA